MYDFRPVLKTRMPDTIPLTEEQFKTFVEQTIATDRSRHSPRTGRGNGGEG